MSERFKNALETICKLDLKPYENEKFYGADKLKMIAYEAVNMKENETCKNCKFFTVDIIEQQYPYPHPEAPKFSQCRRHAPRILSGSGEGWSSQLFPKVEETDWCGEFESES